MSIQINAIRQLCPPRLPRGLSDTQVYCGDLRSYRCYTAIKCWGERRDMILKEDYNLSSEFPPFGRVADYCGTWESQKIYHANS